MRLLWIDNETRVVVRSKRTAILSINEFAIFRLLAARKRMNSRELWDAVYAGASDPPANPGGTVRAAVHDMNRKLARLHVEVTAHNHSNKSFYQMRDTIDEQRQHAPRKRSKIKRLRADNDRLKEWCRKLIEAGEFA